MNTTILYAEISGCTDPKANNYNPEEVLQYYAKICPLLYLKGAILPEVEADEDYFSERFVNEDQWENIYNSLLTVFPGKDDFYTLSYESADNIPLKASMIPRRTAFSPIR